MAGGKKRLVVDGTVDGYDMKLKLVVGETWNWILVNCFQMRNSGLNLLDRKDMISCTIFFFFALWHVDFPVRNENFTMKLQ